MSLRNFVPMMNGPPPPPHHRVPTLQAVNVIQQQGQSQGSANSNQNGSAPQHEYHFMPCIPYQTTGAAPAPNLIRHMPSKNKPQGIIISAKKYISIFILLSFISYKKLCMNNQIFNNFSYHFEHFPYVLYKQFEICMKIFIFLQYLSPS